MGCETPDCLKGHIGGCDQRLFNLNSVFKDEIGIDAEFGVEALGKGHRDASGATHLSS